MPDRILLPLIVACALFMEQLDSTAISTALPAIAADFNDSPIRLKLALTTYLLVLAIGIPASGWMADRFGSRHIFRLALILFATGSILCGLSNSIWELVGARVVQGIGGAMMVPVGRLVILRAIPKDQLVGSLAWLAIPGLIGPALGPLLGGFITTYFEWRWIFWINIPIAVLGVVLATIFMPNIVGDRRYPFDTKGFLLAGFGLVTFVTGSTLLGVNVLPLASVAFMMAVGAVAGIAYILHSRRVSNPILDLTLLRIPTFRLAILGGTLFRLGIGATPFLMPLMFQLTFGMSAFASGVLVFPVAVGAIAMKFVAVPILGRFGFRNVLVWTAVLTGLFVGAYGFMRPGMSLPLLFIFILISGFFRSLQGTSVNAICFADVPREMMSRATSIWAVMQQLAFSGGITIGAMSLTFVSGGDVSTLTAEDFMLPFVIIGILAIAAVYFYLQLSLGAGDHMTRRGEAEKS